MEQPLKEQFGDDFDGDNTGGLQKLKIGSINKFTNAEDCWQREFKSYEWKAKTIKN